jgi:hypothetical protein
MRKQITNILLSFSLACVIFADEKKTKPPYGATRLAETNLNDFKKSMLQEMQNRKIPRPRHYNLFPQKHTLDPHTISKESVLGMAPDNPNFIQLHERINSIFPNQPKCTSISLQSSLAAWRVFVALHETIHYIVGTYNKTFDTKTSEAIADAGTTLYILSNYRNTTDSEIFLGHVADMRTAYYMDAGHSSTNAIEATMDYFNKHPSRDLTIVQTAEIAMRLMPFVEFTAEDEMARSLLISNGINSFFIQNYDALPDDKKTSVTNIMSNILAARNRACDASLK